MPGESNLVSIEPGEVIFEFELKKQISACLHLVNTTDKEIAFKVKTTAPRKYFVRPTCGVLSPKKGSDVVINMIAQREEPPNMLCKDKFLVQSVVAPIGTNAVDVPPELFNKGPGKDVREAKLRVLFVPKPQARSPLLEDASEEFLSPKMAPAVDQRGSRHYIAHDAVSRDVIELKAKLIEARTEHAKVKAEHDAAVQRNSLLLQQLSNMNAEMDKIKGDSSKGNSQALQPHQRESKFLFSLALFIGMLGIVLGILMK